jgi:hypothetical protein
VAKPAKKSEPAPPAERRVLSMELRVGDRIADETGEWKVIGRPYTTKRREGRARPRWDVSQPDVTEIRMWGALERVAIQRS